MTTMGPCESDAGNREAMAVQRRVALALADDEGRVHVGPALAALCRVIVNIARVGGVPAQDLFDGLSYELGLPEKEMKNGEANAE